MSPRPAPPAAVLGLRFAALVHVGSTAGGIAQSDAQRVRLRLDPVPVETSMIAPRHRDRGTPAASAALPTRVASPITIMSRFPKLTETFVLYEILELEALAVAGRRSCFRCCREEAARWRHPEALSSDAAGHIFHPFFSVRDPAAPRLAFPPGRHSRPLSGDFMVRGAGAHRRQPNFLLGALGILPKSVRFAYEMQRLGVTHVHAHFATHPAGSRRSSFSA
jgi:hypothetical protein